MVMWKLWRHNYGIKVVGVCEKAAEYFCGSHLLVMLVPNNVTSEIAW